MRRPALVGARAAGGGVVHGGIRRGADVVRQPADVRQPVGGPGELQRPRRRRRAG